MAMATPTTIHLGAIHPITQEGDIVAMEVMEAMEEVMEDLMEDSQEELLTVDRGAIQGILDHIGIIK